MGFKDTKWAYSLYLPATESAVLAAICHKTDDKTHSTWAKQETLATMTGTTRQTVSKALGVLESLGLITRVKRNDARGHRLASIITANVNETNVGETNVGETNVGETVKPMSATPTAIRTTSLTSTPLSTSGGSHTRGTRIPVPFEVTPEMVAWARERTPLVDGARATERFVNHFMAKTGRDATKRDWIATWRNWLLKDQADAELRPTKLTPEQRLQQTLSLVPDLKEIS